MVVVDQKLNNRSKKMSREQSDGEDSMAETEVVPVDDKAGETEVELCLPRGAGPGLDQIPKDVPVVTQTPECGQTTSYLAQNAGPANPGAWQSTTEGRNTAGN